MVSPVACGSLIGKGCIANGKGCISWLQWLEQPLYSGSTILPCPIADRLRTPAATHISVACSSHDANWCHWHPPDHACEGDSTVHVPADNGSVAGSSLDGVPLLQRLLVHVCKTFAQDHQGALCVLLLC